MKFIFTFLVLLFFAFPLYAQEKFTVYFDSNKFELTPKETAKLNTWIAENKSSKIVSIYGFTDEDGTNGFNDTLAQKRVNFIYKASSKPNYTTFKDLKDNSYILSTIGLKGVYIN